MLRKLDFQIFRIITFVLTLFILYGGLYQVELRAETRRPDMSAISHEDKSIIEYACSHRKASGPAAYNRCLRQKLAELNTDPNRPDMSAISYEDKSIIEYACSHRKASGPAAYNRCLGQKLAELNTDPNRPDMSAISHEDKSIIEYACSHRKASGPAAYNRCLRQKLAELNTDPNRPDMSAISYEDKSIIEYACSHRKASGPAAYNRCLGQKLAELNTDPNRPDMSAISYEDKSIIEYACSHRKASGPAAYNRCLRQKLAELNTDPNRPDMSAISYEDKSIIEYACSHRKASGPAAYNRCLGQKLAEFGEPIEEIKKTKPKRIIKKPSKPSEHVSPKDIGKAQAILYELGYDAGPIDGILGKKTRKAIIEFQRDVGVPITGKVDENLLSLLTAALQIAKTTKKTKPPVQISKQSPKPYSKVPKPVKVLPAMPSKVYKQPLTAADLFKKVQSSIYVVVASSSISELQRGDDIFQGSAVAVSKKCLLTNCHVLENRPYILIMQGEDVLLARLSGIEKESDMCVLTIKKSNLTHIKAIRRFDNLRVGEKVFTVGTPVGLEQTLGEGIISGLRKYKGQKLIQNSAPISSGSSGGGLFDVSGNLIGITTFLLRDAQNLNFAIAAEQYWK